MFTPLRSGRLYRLHVVTQCRKYSKAAGSAPEAGLPPKEGDVEGTGWVLGLALDNTGALRQLKPWDNLQNGFDADRWRWIHLDSRCPGSRRWLAKHCGTRSGKWTTSRLLEDDTTLQPRVTHSDAKDALLVTLQTSLPDTTVGNTPFYSPSLRLWMCERSKLAISTTYCTELLSMLDLPAVGGSSQPEDLGEVATLLVDRMTQANVASCRDAENRLFRVQSELQRAALSAGADVPVPWSRLTDLRAEAVPLHYECIMQRRFVTPQRDALDQLQRFASAPAQPFFSERSRYSLREVALQQDTLVKSLDALCSTSQVLSDQLMTHVTWQGARNSQRLAYLGAFIGVLGSASVAMDVLKYLSDRPVFSGFLAAVKGA
eukprot:Hpha_TRINITY_DN3928_c0_g1::TRINITY_DN3928_c0_g1_i1::g.18133::m.18133/K16074/zntB; zinc transporter